MSRIIRLRESGLYHKWIQLFLKRLANQHLIDESVDEMLAKYEDLSLNYVLDVFYLYLIRILISLFIFLIELLMPYLILYYIIIKNVILFLYCI